MSKIKATIRLRMSAHDAHYGGNLVDGARMLGLFGDVATELLIRHDGDEGLFRAYDSVEFLAPVLCGRLHRSRGRNHGNRKNLPQNEVRGAQGHCSPPRFKRLRLRRA